MVQLTFLLEGYSTLCPDWLSAYEQALEYVEYKANSVMGDRVNAYMKELEKDRPEEEQEALALRRHPALGQEADGHVNEEV